MAEDTSPTLASACACANASGRRYRGTSGRSGDSERSTGRPTSRAEPSFGTSTAPSSRRARTAASAASRCRAVTGPERFTANAALSPSASSNTSSVSFARGLSSGASFPGSAVSTGVSAGHRSTGTRSWVRRPK
ncbi:hypothetical protein COSO111634_35065 [Corallococcus soli]